MHCQKVEPLHEYARRGKYLEVQSLINAGVDIESRDSKGETPLMMAVQSWSHRKVFKLLIDSGADVHCCDNLGHSLLHYAPSVETVKYLVNKGVALDKKTSTGKTPLMFAAIKANTKSFELLLKSGANIRYSDDTGGTVLHHASWGGSLEIVQCLVNEGVNLDVQKSNGKTPLMIAARMSRIKIVELLVNSGANIHCCDDIGETALHHALWGLGSVKIVQCLVNKGADLNVTKSNGQTPLMIAALRRHREVVELLINSGADFHCCDINGWTVLHFSCVSCGSYTKVVELLVRYGLDSLLCDKDNWRLFPDKGSVMEIVKHLVNKGIPLDQKNYHGKTPLHLAIEIDGIEIVDYLLKAGADCNIEDNDGKSPFNYLLEKKMRNVEIISLIKLCIEKGAYVKSSDYKKLSKSTLLKKTILKDVKICSQAVINKFNNKDLHSLYKRVTSAQKLPDIDLMKIGNQSGMALGVEESVTHEIQSIGFCNVFKMVPLVLGILCVNSFIENSTPAFNEENSSKSRKRLKRL